MEFYEVNEPVKIVEMDNKKYIMSIPRKWGRLEYTKYAEEFLNFIGSNKYISVTRVEEYLSTKSEDEVVELRHMFLRFLQEDIISPT